MNKIKKLYRDFFGLREQNEKSQSMFHVSDTDVSNMQKMAAAAKQLKQSLGEEELDEAQLLNRIIDYRGGVEYVLRDPAEAKSVAQEISEWATKKGFTIIKQTTSASGKVGYFYFRLGQDRARESQRIQGYISQKPEIKHFRFKVRNEQPVAKTRPEI